MNFFVLKKDFRNTFTYLIFFLLSLGLIPSSHSQSNKLEAGLINSGIGGLIGGIGRVINKEKHEKFGPVFIKGFGMGAVGGSLVFASKSLTTSIYKNDNYNLVYPSKVLNSIGSSIINNAAANDDILENIHFNIGFLRLNLNTKDKLKPKIRILASSIGFFTTYVIDPNYKLDLSESLKLGAIVFKVDNLVNDNINHSAANLSNLIFLTSKATMKAKSHELIHVYQYDQFSGLNNFFNPVITKSKFFEKISNYLYLDFQEAFMQFYTHISIYEHNIREKDAVIITDDKF